MKATVSPQDSAASFLEDLVDKHAGRITTLIICHTRAAFLHQILPVINPPQTEAETSPPPHRLLHPTLALLSCAKLLKLIYTPTLPVLRAYLSTHAQTSLLAILDLTLLHHSTSEFSAQGLARTFSALSSAAARNDADVLLAECKDVHDVRNPERGPRLWDARVALLSGSVRVGGGASVGRTVSVGRVVGRWFQFEERQREQEEMEEEMLV